MTVVATVGTTHPLAFAGLTFALLALADDAVRPVCVVAGVTAQDAANVTARTPVDASSIQAQFESIRAAPVEAFHVGALLAPDSVYAVAAGLKTYPGIPAVIDPVLAATGGDDLADDATRQAIRAALIARATLITPNLAEAGALLNRPVTGVASMREAAQSFIELGAQAALIKGGHLEGTSVTDVLADAHGTHDLTSPRIPGTLRGTGDLLAVTIAACLARGATLSEAVEHARRRVREAIARGIPFAGTRVANFSSD